MDIAVNWSRLGRAVDFYRQRGYQYVEVPWAVSPEATAITCPRPEFTAEVEGWGSLVGSAEQSFIQMLMDETLTPGKYVACSPCVRLGDVQDDLHQVGFMKVELFRTDRTDDSAVESVIEDARLFMNLELSEHFIFNRTAAPYVDRVQTPEGFDLELHGIEVGSYGRRSHPRMWSDWICGTGLAEPRFSTARALGPVSERWAGALKGIAN